MFINQFYINKYRIFYRKCTLFSKIKLYIRAINKCLIKLNHIIKSYSVSLLYRYDTKEAALFNLTFYINPYI